MGLEIYLSTWYNYLILFAVEIRVSLGRLVFVRVFLWNYLQLSIHDVSIMWKENHELETQWNGHNNDSKWNLHCKLSVQLCRSRLSLDQKWDQFCLTSHLTVILLLSHVQLNWEYIFRFMLLHGRVDFILQPLDKQPISLHPRKMKFWTKFYDRLSFQTIFRHHG